VSNFEVDFKNVCQITKAKPWLLKKSSDIKNFHYPNSQSIFTKNMSKLDTPLNNNNKSNILIKGIYTYHLIIILLLITKVKEEILSKNKNYIKNRMKKFIFQYSCIFLYY